MEAEWPQYRGRAGDGIAAETVPLPVTGIKPTWTIPTATGFSSFTASGGKLFTLVSRDSEGAPLVMCVAIDAATGKELWATPTGVAKFDKGGDSGSPDNNGGDGPRSTPAVSDNRVYVYSTEMVLHCLDAATGKPLWKHEIIKEYNGHNIGWKSAMSPMIKGNLVYVAGGGAEESFLAFDKASGNLAWKGGTESMTHASPTFATIGGVKQVIFIMQSGLVALEANTGKELWKFPFPYRTSTACSPVVSGNIVFCTAGYDIGATACEVTKAGDGFSAKEIWRSRGNNPLGSLWSTPLQKDGFLYGIICFKEFGKARLKCADLKTGEVKWEQPGFGGGNVLLAGDRLICLSDDGNVVFVQASPDGYKELARFKAVSGKCWSSPALSEGKLYIRSTKEGACFDLTAR